MKKRLEKIALRIVELEKKAQENKDFNYEAAMMMEVKNLSLKEMLEIDNYIQSKKLLTK